MTFTSYPIGFDPDEEERIHDAEVAANGGRVVRYDPSDDGAGLESWRRVDLGPALAGAIERVMPIVCVRDDGLGLLYPRSVNGFHADSGIGKTMLGILGAAQELRAGNRVCWVDLESDASVVVERLRLHGVGDQQIHDGLDYFTPKDPFSRDAIDSLVAHAHEWSLFVLDSVGEAFGLDGVDEDRDAQVGPWLRRVARPIAEAGPAVLLIDHATKAAGQPLQPSGSKRKRAAITGASYLIEAPRPLTRELGGRLRITVAKDRHGNYARGAVAANYDMLVDHDGCVSIKLYAPSPAAQDRTAGEILLIAHKATQAVKRAGVPMTGRQIESAMGVTAGAAKKRAGIAHALSLGALKGEPGTRGAVLHTYVHDVAVGDEQ